MLHAHGRIKTLITVMLSFSLAAALGGCPVPVENALSLYEILDTATELAQILENDDGEQLALLAEKDSGGEITGMRGGAFFTPGGAAVTFWIGDNGLPLYAVAEGYFFHFYNYTGNTMDLIVTAPGGASVAINGVSILAAQVDECEHFAAEGFTTGDIWRWISACTGIVGCGVSSYAEMYSVDDLAEAAGIECGGTGLDIIDTILDATGGSGFGAGVDGTSLSGVSTPGSCTNILSCALDLAGWSAGQIGTAVGEAEDARDSVLGGSQYAGLRFVLTWGEYPYDLDSHLWTPSIDGTSHHIYYSNRHDYSLAASPFADLDVDDTVSYGPETVTIAQLFPGTYLYSVYNYSGTPDMTTSGAKVSVFDSQGLVGQYSIPTSGTGRWWHVFEIDGTAGALTLVNTINDTSNKSFDATIDAK